MSPQHPLDDRLKAYAAGESWPPEAEDELQYRQRRTLARVKDTDTGVHDVKELMRLSGEREAAYQKDRLDEEREKRLAAEKTIRDFWKWVAGIVAGIIVLVAGAGILWSAAKLNH